MNERMESLMYLAGLTAQGCWDEMDAYDRQAIKKFAELIVQECAGVCESMPLIGPYKEVQDATLKDAAAQIKEHFGVEE